jgi:hypothetical protein
LQFWWFLSSALYPPDEPALPAAIHIRRALGGPTASFLLTLIAGDIALALAAVGGVLWYGALFFCLDNLFVFTLGAFLSLGFTDGSTLLHWLRKRWQPACLKSPVPATSGAATCSAALPASPCFCVSPKVLPA